MFFNNNLQKIKKIIATRSPGASPGETLASVDTAVYGCGLTIQAVTLPISISIDGGTTVYVFQGAGDAIEVTHDKKATNGNPTGERASDISVIGAGTYQVIIYRGV